MSKDLDNAQDRLFKAEADLNQCLHLFGNDLAKKMKYKEQSGINAVKFYLMEKHHWLPSQVNSMTYEDMRFALSEEMSGWTK